MQRTLQSVVMGSSENCLSDAASRPANSAAQGAPYVAHKTQNGPSLHPRSGRFVASGSATVRLLKG
jgi:hypothetical protein